MYEHLDVLWTIDAVEKVGKKVKYVLHDIMPIDAKRSCRSIESVRVSWAGRHEEDCCDG